MALTIKATLADGLRGVVCVAGSDVRQTAGEDVVVSIGDVGREFTIAVYGNRGFVEEVTVAEDDLRSRTAEKKGARVAVRWVLEGIDLSKPMVRLAPPDLQRAHTPPMAYIGDCTLTITTPTSSITSITLTTPGPLRTTQQIVHGSAHTSFPILTSEDFIIVELGAATPLPTLLVKLDEKKTLKTYCLKQGVWKSGSADPQQDGIPSLAFKTDLVLKQRPQPELNTLHVVQGRFPSSSAVHRWTIAGHESKGDWPYWGGAKVSEVAPGTSLDVLKDGKPYGKISVPRGKGAGWVGSSDGHSSRGWPNYEVYLVWNFPEEKPVMHDIELLGVRARKLIAPDGQPPQAVACGIVCLEEIRRQSAVTPTDSVWVWQEAMWLRGIPSTTLPLKVAVTMLEDVEGLPLGTGYFELTDKKLSDSQAKELRLGFELANDRGDPAGSAEVVIRTTAKTQGKVGGKTKKKPKPKAQQATKAKATLLVSVQRLRGTSASSIRVRLGTRQPEVKEIKEASHCIFTLPRLRELLNLKIAPQPGGATGQISFLVEPLISEGCFKSTSGEGWVYLQPDAGPYYDLVTNANLGEVYVRWSLDVKQTMYYELPTGRDLEHHVKWAQLIRKPHTTAPRQVKRDAPVTTLPPTVVNLKVKQILLREGSKECRIVEVSSNKTVPVGTKVKLAVQSAALQLNLSRGQQAVGVCSVPLETPAEGKYPVTRYGEQVGELNLRWDVGTREPGTMPTSASPAPAPAAPAPARAAHIKNKEAAVLNSLPPLPQEPVHQSLGQYATGASTIQMDTGYDTLQDDRVETLELQLVDELSKRETAEQNEVYYKAATEEAGRRAKVFEERNVSLKSELQVLQSRYQEVMVGSQQRYSDSEVQTMKAQLERMKEEMRVQKSTNEELRRMNTQMQYSEADLEGLRRQLKVKRYTENDMDVARGQLAAVKEALRKCEGENGELVRELRLVEVKEQEIRDMTLTVEEQDRQLTALRSTNSALESTVRDLRSAETAHVSRDVLHDTLQNTAHLERQLQEAQQREQSLLSYIDTLKADLESSSRLLTEVAHHLP